LLFLNTPMYVFRLRVHSFPSSLQVRGFAEQVVAISLKKDGVKASAYTKGLDKLSGAEQRTTKEKLEALVAANPVESATPGETLKADGKEETGLIWTQCIIRVCNYLFLCLLASNSYVLRALFALPNNTNIFP